MAQVNKSVLVEHSAAQMFALVDRVEEYPLFLPWCSGTKLLERSADVTVATIDIDYHGVRQSFTTRNRKTSPEWMRIELERGPFRHLSGHWHFRALSAQACKVAFSLEYEFSARLLERVVGPVFSHIANSFVEAFVVRAERLYGGGETRP